MEREQNNTIPKQKDAYRLVQNALIDLGGKARRMDVIDKCAEMIDLSDKARGEQIKSQGRGRFDTVIEFARNTLREQGYVQETKESGHGKWALTRKGWHQSIDNETIEAERKRIVKERSKRKEDGEQPDNAVIIENTTEDTTRKELLDYIRNMDETAFERLCRDVLDRDGFIAVNTQKTRDGGKDGIGEIMLTKIVGLSVIFECKRYKDNKVPISALREFSAQERTYDRLIFFTSSYFTSGYRTDDTVRLLIQAGRLILIDGDRLVDLMLEYKIGVSDKIDKEYLDAI